MNPRRLVLVFGDQLDSHSAAFDGFDNATDAVLMIEARHEASYIPQHKRRLVFFFAAMRHFAAAQRDLGRQVHYARLDDPANRGSFGPEIRRWVDALHPQEIVALEPGDWRVRHELEQLEPDIEIRPDRHFLADQDMFADLGGGRRRVILETFYREMRRRLNILMDDAGEPVGGAWNFDQDNRAAFGRKGPPLIAAPPRFDPDPITRSAIELVVREFPNSPGRLDNFDFAVTREHGLVVLKDFVTHRLRDFGRFQDAMHSNEAFLFHSQLSGVLNLHLLHPREVVDAALSIDAPLNAVEGFVRQIIGWREFVRAIYWRGMPGYADRNELGADLPMPRFYWTGETDMRCLSQAIGHTIDHAYAHHIERLMVLGLFLLLLGVRPYDVHRWHMSMFRDAIDWVSLPNALGVSQHADGGVMGTKPYAASGAYINRMSDHCRHCRYDPRKATGDDACPFTTLYWDFLARHEERFASNRRMGPVYANLARKEPEDIVMIRRRADQLKARLTAETFL